MVFKRRNNMNGDWIASNRFTITFTKNGDISIIYSDSQMNCKSTYKFNESEGSIDSPENCANFKFESVDNEQLILFHQGREYAIKYKFKRC